MKNKEPVVIRHTPPKPHSPVGNAEDIPDLIRKAKRRCLEHGDYWDGVTNFLESLRGVSDTRDVLTKRQRDWLSQIRGELR